MSAEDPEERNASSGESPAGSPGRETGAAPSPSVDERGVSVEPSPGEGRARLILAAVLLALMVAEGFYMWWLLERRLDVHVHEHDALLESKTRDWEALAGRTSQLDAALREDMTALRAEARENGAGLAALKARVEALSGEEADAKQRLAQAEQALRALQDSVGRDERAWRLAEVEYLIGRAQERLRVGRDAAGAREALTLADQRLAALGDAAALPLREALAREQAGLGALSAPDLPGLVLKLRAQAERVSGFPLRHTGGDVTDASAVTPSMDSVPVAERPWWGRAWDWVVEQTRALIVVRHDGARDEAVLSRSDTDREMRLWLMSVREALVAGQAEALALSVNEARGWLVAHYDSEASGPAALLRLLDESALALQGPQWPDLGALSAQLRQLSASGAAAGGE